MDTSQAHASPVSGTIIHYRLNPDQAELVLIALYVLDEVTTGTLLPIEKTLEKARRFYSIGKLPSDLITQISQLSDKIWNPLFDVKFPMTPADRLLAIDAEGLSDEEAFAIIRDIETTYSKIDFEATSHDYAI